jgi:uncharacterized protein (DUF1778 family)
MSRISIDVTPEQHKRLKAIAALRGKSIKQLILDSTLGRGATEALEELEGLLDRRRVEAEASKGRRRSVEEVFATARRRSNGRRRA